MPWFKVDDQFPEHRKVRKLGEKDRSGAVGVWLLCGTWSSVNLTDGFVPCEVVRRHDSNGRFSKALVRVGLWHECEHDGERGYLFHKWADYQPTREEVLQQRKSNAERMARWRANKQRSHGVSNGVTDGASDKDRALSPYPYPKVTPDGVTSMPRNKRGRRIPEDFEATPEMVAWARENTPDVDGKRETEKFIDYWTSKAGKDAAKLDWERTWRNWMRNAQERAPRAGKGSQPYASPTDQNIREFLGFDPFAVDGDVLDDKPREIEP